MVSSRPDRIRDHWWRPGWRVGRRFYTWHITFEGQDDLHRLVRAYQDHLAMPGLDLVPFDGVHLTMQGVGFTDEVSQQDVQAIVMAAAARCAPLAPFILTLGPARIRPEGVNLPVTPEAPVRRLRMAIREAIAEIWGEEKVPESAEEFTPHVTLAYSNADGPAAPIIEQIEQVGVLQAVTPIRAAQLIDLERDTHVYRWRTQAAVPLLGKA